MEINGTLHFEHRANTSSKANGRLRKEGYLPGNIYAKGMDSVAITVKKDELRKNLARYGRSALFKLKDQEGKVYDVMVKDIQNAPITSEFQHVDFQKVSLKEEIKANVPICIEGKESLEFRGLLMMRHLDQIHVKGLPQHIPNTIDVIVSELHAGDNITVGDILFPKGIVPETDAAILVVNVIEAKAQPLETEGLEGEDEKISDQED